MGTHNRNFMIAILAAVSFAGVIPAYAVYYEQACPDCKSAEKYDKEYYLMQILPIFVSIDKTVYDHQSIILLNGHVKDTTSKSQVGISIVDPIGNVVMVDQLAVDDKGDFESKINTASPIWVHDGPYTIVAQYGHNGRQIQAQFQLVSTVSACDSSSISAVAETRTYCIPYKIQNAIVKNAVIDRATKSLVLNIEAKDSGTLTLEIPRSVIDAKTSSGENDRFFITVNGQEMDIYSEEKTTETARTLTFKFESGIQKIEIIGTQIVPEFGAIAALVLAIAIISIIAVSAKTRLRLMPKY